VTINDNSKAGIFKTISVYINICMYIIYITIWIYSRLTPLTLDRTIYFIFFISILFEKKILYSTGAHAVSDAR